MSVITVDLDLYLASPGSEAALVEAKKAAQSLIQTGALVVKDSRAAKAANDRFIDLFEDYFAQDDELLKVDERPELGYQVVSLHGLACGIRYDRNGSCMVWDER
jgi:hypothetical protein